MHESGNTTVLTMVLALKVSFVERIYTVISGHSGVTWTGRVTWFMFYWESARYYNDMVLGTLKCIYRPEARITSYNAHISHN